MCAVLGGMLEWHNIRDFMNERSKVFQHNPVEFSSGELYEELDRLCSTVHMKNKKRQKQNKTLTFLIFLMIQFQNFPKLRTTVHPSKIARIGAKLCQNAFQTIPDISFFDEEQIKKMRFF